MRAVVRAQVRVAAPAAVVWDYVTDWSRQGEWMPLTRVEVVPDGTGDRRARHVGGRVRARTGLGPLGFWDPLTVTAWEEQADGSGRCQILHTGRVVRGDAELEVLAQGPDSCTASVWEHIEIPGGPVGALLWRLAGRFADRAADRVLRRMARRAERLPGRGRG